MVGGLATIIGYLLGSIPFGYLIVRWQKGIDVRATGSGSIGATNVMRSLGIAGFVATLLLDFGKGAAAVLLAARMTGNDPRFVAAAALAALIGHCYPAWLKFRGGKAVATAAGVFLVLAPMSLGLALLIFGLVVGIWRYVSLGSILAAAAFPALAYLLEHPPAPIVLAAAFGAALIILRHHGNIRRLLSGTENRLGTKPPAVSHQRSAVESGSPFNAPGKGNQ